ncbi:MAG: hypothetical protein WKG07_05475 [Hymenobacter sp.]
MMPLPETDFVHTRLTHSLETAWWAARWAASPARRVLEADGPVAQQLPDFDRGLRRHRGRRLPGPRHRQPALRPLRRGRHFGSYFGSGRGERRTSAALGGAEAGRFAAL